MIIFRPNLLPNCRDIVNILLIEYRDVRIISRVETRYIPAMASMYYSLFHRIFYYILKAMDRDWNECLSNDTYMSTMTSMADLARRFSNMVLAINAVGAFFLSIGEHLFQSMGDANRASNSSRELPIKMQLPFEVGESPIFECFLVGQFIYDLIIAFVVGMMNALLVTLVSLRWLCEKIGTSLPRGSAIDRIFQKCKCDTALQFKISIIQKFNLLLSDNKSGVIRSR